MEYDDLDRLTYARRTNSTSNIFNFTYIYNSIGNMLNIFFDNGNITFTYNQSKPIHAPDLMTVNS